MITDTEQTPGLRERKKRETTQRIQDAALALCLKHGYEQTRVEDIADAAGVSPRTLFRYFATKEDIFRDDDVALLGALAAMVSGRERGTSVVDAIFAFSGTVAEAFTARREFFVKRHRLFLATPYLARHSSTLRPRFVEALTRALGGHASSQFRLRVAMGALEGAIDAALAEWLDRDGEPSLHRLWKQAQHLLEPMLREVLD